MSLVFRSLLCLDVEFFGLLLFGVYSASQNYKFMYFAKLGDFFSHYLFKCLSRLPSFVSPCKISVTQMCQDNSIIRNDLLNQFLLDRIILISRIYFLVLFSNSFSSHLLWLLMKDYQSDPTVGVN